ncbi:SIR2 family protein [Enterobacter asburiae]|uniref:SIR2 family NAD-dependent protein deacylase n=1 Tax=Enterobacter asburiae TaxID=61645 RepID=UPI0032AEDE29
MVNKNKIKPLLNNISSRLWEGRAAILVGAGFSRNAKALTDKARKFPMWNDLGDIFYESVYCEKNSHRYSNVLKLGDEVQAAFGRATLDKLIMDHIPDKEYEPSKLHISLLSLPWIDVFTTNYDTLLERTCVYVDSRKYDVVLNKNDLMNAERPRIIKLHGSFPSERPFIITEEDYRKYPLDNSLFVNTVQQSLIENTLCLIGFSGDDPNFLNWIGWIRDNLGAENSPKIYLIGLYSFNEAQRKLLEKSNISIVDLSLLGEFDVDHYEAYNQFIQYLYESKNKNYSLEWPNEILESGMAHDETPEQSYTKIVSAVYEWEKSRHSYPNWLILPESNRDKIWYQTREWLPRKNLEIPWADYMDLKFGYELLWRLSRALLPIFEETSNFLFDLVDKYKLNFVSVSNIVKDKNIDEKLPHILIGLLKFCRQEKLLEKWNELSGILQPKLDKLTPEVRSEYYYESILFSYCNLNFDEARAKLSNWETNKLLPHHEIKRAGLMAEFGMIEEAINVLEETLSTIRRNSLLSSRKIDYSSESQEAYAIYILRMFKRRNWHLDDNDVNSSEYNSRLAILAQYHCNPENEIKYLEIKLESRTSYASNDKRADFDLNSRTVTNYFGNTIVESTTLSAFSFLLLCEELGLPFHIPGMNIFSGIVENASMHIYPHSPEWSIFSIFRTFNNDKAKSLFNRNMISAMNRERIEELFDSYYIKYSQLITKKINDRLDESLEIENATLSIIPEILSRLVTKTSFEKKKNIIILLQKLFTTPTFDDYYQTKDLLKRTIANLSDAQIISLISIFLEFPSQPTNNDPRARYNYTTPFECFLNIQRDKEKGEIKKITSHKIKKDINDIKSNDINLRKAASQKLIILYTIGMLNKSDISKLIKALWSNLDEFGFPNDSGYYKFFFIHNLHPENENTEEKFKPIIELYKFPVQIGNSVRITGGTDEYCKELNGALHQIKLPAQIISKIILNMISWFNTDKHRLDKPENMAGEFTLRFKNIGNITTSILETHQDVLSARNLTDISELLDDMANKHISVEPALTMLSLNNKHLLPERLNAIERGFYSSNKNIVIDAIRSSHALIRNKACPSEIIDSLGDKILWNKDPCLPECHHLAKTVLIDDDLTPPNSFMNKVLIGLDSLKNINIVDFKTNSEHLSHLEKKLSATILAATIYKKYTQKKIPLPSIIEEWMVMCNSHNEFEEIRNEWENNI